MLQHIQASIFHYNTIGLRAVSIKIWPSADSMYFEHYLYVLAGTPIIYMENGNKLFIHMCGIDRLRRFCYARTYDHRIRSLLLAVMTSYL